jgi:hypothetical protein
VSLKTLTLTLALAVLPAAIAAQERGSEIGLRFAFSAPSGDAEITTDPGMNAGLTATFMRNRVVGVGFDVGYHRWPGSPYANDTMDEFWSRLSGTTITGSRVNLSTLEFVGHLKVVPPARGAVAPWIKTGAGLFRVNTELRLPVDQLEAAGWQVLNGSSGSIDYRLGSVVGAGFDIKTGRGLTVALDTSFLFLLWSDERGANFTAMTLGVSLLR